MSSHGKVQAGDNLSENMPSTGIKHATSHNAVESVIRLTISAIFKFLYICVIAIGSSVVCLYSFREVELPQFYSHRGYPFSNLKQSSAYHSSHSCITHLLIISLDISEDQVKYT